MSILAKIGHQVSRARAALFYAPLYAAATIGYGLVSMAWSRFDASGRHQHNVARAWARMLCRIAGIEVEVRGLENLITDRPSVMVCNHLSYMDTPVLFGYLPLQFRILARKGLFSIPFLGGHLKRCQHLPVDQSNVRASMRSLQAAAESLRGGLPLFVFPEAGRSFQGDLKEFVGGAFYIAIQAQAPVVPLVLIGTWEILEPGTSHLRPGKATLIICPPVETTGLTRRDTDALATKIREQMLAVYAAERTNHAQPHA